MKLRRFILLGLLISIGILNAQTDFKPGYVIKATGDTVFGQIDYRGDLIMNGLCKFKNDNNTIKEYSPDDIVAFRFLDSKYYVTKKINNKKSFMEYLIKGKINIYYMRDENGGHYYLDKEDTQLTEIPYEEGIKYVDDKQIFYESKKHIGILNYYMQDAPEIQSKIQSVKKPEHQTLIKLAEDYHNVVCDGEKCIIYEKEVPLLKISITPFIGLAKYNGYDKLATEFGGYLYFWAPRTSEKLFFKTGLVYNKISEDGTDLTVFKIPIQLQYIFRAHKLQPHISGGINFFNTKLEDYKSISNSLSLNAGLNYQISTKISIISSFNSDYTPLFMGLMDEYTEFDIISYSILVGLRIDL